MWNFLVSYSFYLIFFICVMSTSRSLKKFNALSPILAIQIRYDFKNYLFIIGEIHQMCKLFMEEFARNLNIYANVTMQYTRMLHKFVLKIGSSCSQTIKKMCIERLIGESIIFCATAVSTHSCVFVYRFQCTNKHETVQW